MNDLPVLVESAREGDLAAFEALVGRFQSMAFGYACSVLGDRSLAEDAAQEAFIEASAFQCGFCTPGFIMMTKKLLEQHPKPTDDQIKHYLTGNLCRCSAYPEIIEAVKLAAARAAT